MHVIDVATGKETLAVELEGQTGATPAVAGDSLFVGTMAKNVLCVDWKKGEVVWEYVPSRRANDFYASAAVTDSAVIVGSRDKKVHAIDRKDGKELWTYATKGHVDSSPVVAGKLIYVGSLDGNLYVLDLQGAVVQTIKIGAEVSASPAVANGCLVIGAHDGRVLCLAGPA
jgi:outer membrane protein assembly factor BamB